MPSLTTAIERLYATFAPYRRGTTEGCPCCVTREQRERLHARPLRQIAGKALGIYAFKAMTTWGGVDDFRHFLPRIFELATTDELGYDPEIVVGDKLVYARWREWPEREHEAVEAFLFAWCEHARVRWDACSVLAASIVAGLPLQALLDAWRDDHRPSADGGWLSLLESLSRKRTLGPWTSPETSDEISRWLWEPAQRARLERITEALSDDADREKAHADLVQFEARIRGA